MNAFEKLTPAQRVPFLESYEYDIAQGSRMVHERKAQGYAQLFASITGHLFDGLPDTEWRRAFPVLLSFPVEDLPMSEVVEKKIAINYCALLSPIGSE